jgi:hypothetical protein
MNGQLLTILTLQNIVGSTLCLQSPILSDPSSSALPVDVGPCIPVPPPLPFPVISELCDMPIFDERFLEIVNSDSAASMNLDGWSLVRHSNGNFLGSASIDLSGMTLAPGEYLVVAKDQTAFEARWGTGIANVVYSSTVNVNGDDVLALKYNGTVYEIYGELGVDGTGEAWEYTDSCATRAEGSVANPIWTAGEWTIDSDTTNASPGSPGGPTCSQGCGDVDGSGVYDITDVTTITSYLQGGSLDACQFWAADVDADGDVDSDDQIALFGYLASSPTSPYPGCM